MLSDAPLEKLIEDIGILIPYAVPPEELETATAFLDSFSADLFALEIIKDYYQTLPNAKEEALVKIAVLEEREQVYLLLLSTTGHHHFYVTNGEESMFLAEWEQGLQDKQLLEFFGYTTQEQFVKAHPDKGNVREYQPLERMNASTCPSCGVQTGSMHTLGCPIEVCPWCGGQLNHCNCRFEQLGVDELQDDAMLEKFIEKLERKGRVAYAEDQRPTFMTNSSE